MEGVDYTPPLAELMSRSPSPPHLNFPLSFDKGEEEMDLDKGERETKEEEWWEDSPILELQGTEKNKTLGLYDQDSMMVETYSNPNQLEVYQKSNSNDFVSKFE